MAVSKGASGKDGQPILIYFPGFRWLPVFLHQKLLLLSREAIVTWEGSWGPPSLPPDSSPHSAWFKEYCYSPENARIISGEVDGSLVTEIKGCGYGLCYQEPERFAIFLTGFFEDGEEK